MISLKEILVDRMGKQFAIDTVYGVGGSCWLPLGKLSSGGRNTFGISSKCFLDLEKAHNHVPGTSCGGALRVAGPGPSTQGRLVPV